MRGRGLACRGVECGLRVDHGLARMRDFFRRDRMLGEQRLAALEVGLRAREVFPLRGDGGIVLAGQLRLLAHLAHSLRQRTLRLGQREVGIGRIEFDQHLARIHALGVVGEDFGHGARHLR